MREYVIALIVTLGVCSLAAIMSPEGERGLAGYIKLTAGLCVLCVAISPVSSFIGRIYSFELDFKIPDNDKELSVSLENIYGDMLRNYSGSNIAEKLSDLICRDIGLGNEDIEVFVDVVLENGESVVKKVSVVLSGNAVLSDPKKIGEYVTTTVGGECEIVYK